MILLVHAFCGHGQPSNTFQLNSNTMAIDPKRLDSNQEIDAQVKNHLKKIEDEWFSVYVRLKRQYIQDKEEYAQLKKDNFLFFPADSAAASPHFISNSSDGPDKTSEEKLIQPFDIHEDWKALQKDCNSTIESVEADIRTKRKNNNPVETWILNDLLDKKKQFRKVYRDLQQAYAQEKLLGGWDVSANGSVVHEWKRDGDGQYQRFLSLENNPENAVNQDEIEESKSDDDAPTYRIVNDGRFLGRQFDHVSAHFNKAEYRALEEMGIGKKNNALTAKVIKIVGRYRHQALKDVILDGFSSPLVPLKEELCQFMFKRMRALAIVEGAYGLSEEEVYEKSRLYFDRIVYLRLEYKFKKERMTDTRDPLFELYNQAIEALESDEKAIDELLSMNGEQEDGGGCVKGWGSPLNAYQSNRSIQDFGHDSTKLAVGEWVRKRAFRAVESLKMMNEHITIGQRAFTGRGKFQSVVADAFYECTHHEYANRPRDPKNDFGGSEKITLSSAELATGENELKNVLFAFSCVKNKADQRLADLATDADQQYTHRGWARPFHQLSRRFFPPPKRAKTVETAEEITGESSLAAEQADNAEHAYQTLIKKFGVTHESRTQAFLQACMRLMESLGHLLSHLPLDCWNGIVEAFRIITTRLTRDFIVNLDQAKKEKDLPDLLKAFVEQDEKRPIDQQEDNLQRREYPFLKDDLSEGFHPRTLLEVVELFLTDFGSFFERNYEKAPLTWTLATGVYILAGFAAASPQALQAFLAGLGIKGAGVDGLCHVSLDVAKAMAGENGHFIGAGFTGMKAVFVGADTLSEGGDSLLYRLFEDLKETLPYILTGGVLAWGSGALLAHVPGVGVMVRHESGEIKFFGYSLFGGKTLALAWEALHHEETEKNSCLSNSISTLFRLIYNLLVCVPALLWNLGCAAWYNGYLYPLMAHDRPDEDELPDPDKQIFEEDRIFLVSGHLDNAFRPFLKLVQTLLLSLVATLDFVFRVVRMLCVAVKAIVKAVIEALLNMIIRFSPSFIACWIISAKFYLGSGFDECTRFLTVPFARVFRFMYEQLRRKDWQLSEIWQDRCYAYRDAKLEQLKNKSVVDEPAECNPALREQLAF